MAETSPGRFSGNAIAAAALLLVVQGCGDGTTSERGNALEAALASESAALEWAPPPTCSTMDAETSASNLEVVASGLSVPWDLDFAPDGRMFVTERGGRVRVVQDATLREGPWAAFDSIVSPGYQAEAGLMGIAVAPDFSETGHVYVMGTFARPAGRLVRAWRKAMARFEKPARSAYERRVHIENRVYRLTDRDGHGADRELVIGGLPAGMFHAGGALDFGPDGMLYVTVGESFQTERSGEPTSLLGKVLRYRPDGGIPADNPVPGSPVYAHGLRNSEGLAWHPVTGELFAAELGDDRDELNLIVPGGDYGWPETAGMVATTRFRAPLTMWHPSIAPAGLDIQPTETPRSADAFLGGLRGQQLRRAALRRDGDTWAVACEQALLQGEVGRVRAIAFGPDGQLYFTTSNQDGRARPRPGDDHVYRLMLRP